MSLNILQFPFPTVPGAPTYKRFIIKFSMMVVQKGLKPDESDDFLSIEIKRKSK